MQQELESIEQLYDLEEVIGRGAFGEVVRAVDRRTSQKVAIKRLVGARHDPLKYERFRREAALLSQVDSEHVVRYLAHGVDRELTPCLVLEWLNGEDLGQRQQRAPLSNADVVHFARQALAGLTALHSLGIVHRDVKPSNFFLCGDPADPQVKLIDLGIARAVTGLSVTLDGFRVGTPSYMSPEQARGDEIIGPRSDLFSLGVVMYELLAGAKPFRAADPHALLAKIVLQQATPLRSIVGVAIPSELADIVSRLMEKFPENRPANAKLVSEMLPNELSMSRQSIPPMMNPDETATMELSSSGLSIFAERRVISALFADYSKESSRQDRAAFELAVAQQQGTVHPIIGGRAVGVFGLAHSTGSEMVRAGHAALTAARSSKHLQLALVIGRVITDRAELLSADAIERGMATLACLPADKMEARIAVDAASARLLTAHFVLSHDSVGTALLQSERRVDDGSVHFGGTSKETIGRDREIGTLSALAAESVGESVSRVALVTGAAGVGKTRIRREFMWRTRQENPDTLTLLAHGDSTSMGSPYALLGNALLNASAAIEESEPFSRAAKIKSFVSEDVGDSSSVSRVAGFFLTMCNIRLQEEQLVALLGADFYSQWVVAQSDPLILGDCLRAAWLDWLSAVAEKRLVVCVLENLQWSDRSTLQLIDATLRTLHNRPICVCAFGRPEVDELHPALWAERSVQQIRVAPLSRRASERLVRSLVGDVYPFEEKVLTLADGNPFFIEEILRSLAAGGSVSSLPDSVSGMVQVQLDTLDPTERRLLRVASVFGRSFWRGALIDLLSDGPQDSFVAGSVRRWLSELERRELIARSKSSMVAHEDEYVFRHAIVHDVAYSMLTEDDRIAAHRRAGMWLEKAQYGDDQVLAGHYEQGMFPHRAAVFYARSAARAMAGDDLKGAISNAQRALEQVQLHEKITDVSDTDLGLKGVSELEKARLDALLIQAEAHRWQGNVEACVTYAREAMERAPVESAYWFRSLGERANALGRLVQYDDLETLSTRWLQTEPSADVVGVAIAAGGRMTAQLMVVGRLLAGRAMLDRLSELVEKHAPDDPIADARFFQGRAQLALHEGNKEEYLHWITRTTASFARGGDKRNECIQGVNVGNALAHLGAYQRATEMLTPLLVTADRLGLRTGLAFVRSTLGLVAVRRGEFEQGLQLQLQADRVFSTQKDVRMRAFAMIYIADAHRGLGNLELAHTIAREALDQFALVPTTRGPVLAVLARIRFEMGAVQDALTLSREGFQILQDPTVAIEEGEIALRVVYAESLIATKDRATALSVLDETVNLVQKRVTAIGDLELRASFMAIEENVRALQLYRALTSD